MTDKPPTPSPRPWNYRMVGTFAHIDSAASDPDTIATVWSSEGKAEANAALIVRTLNAHDTLVAALREIAEGRRAIAGPPDVLSAVRDYHEIVADIARTALAKVEGAT